MPKYFIEFKIGATIFYTGNFPSPPRIGEKIRYNDSNGEEVILQIEDIIYEFIPGEHRYVTVTAQCKLL